MKKGKKIMLFLVLLIIIYVCLVYVGVVPNPINVLKYHTSEPQFECGPDSPPWCEQNNSYECQVEGLCWD